MSVLMRRKDVKFKPQGRHSQLDRQTAPLVDKFITLDSHKMLTSTKGFVDAISDISAVNNDTNQVSLGQKAFCYMKKTHLSMATVKMSEQLYWLLKVNNKHHHYTATFQWYHSIVLLQQNIYPVLMFENTTTIWVIELGRPSKQTV